MFRRAIRILASWKSIDLDPGRSRRGRENWYDDENGNAESSFKRRLFCWPTRGHHYPILPRGGSSKIQKKQKTKNQKPPAQHSTPHATTTSTPLLLPGGLDDIRRLLRDGISNRLEMGSRHQRVHAGVDNAEVCRSIHQQVGAHHAPVLKGGHGGGAG